MDVRGSNLNFLKLDRMGTDKETNVHARMSMEVLDYINSTSKLSQLHTKHMTEKVVVSSYTQKETSIEA